ncbi:MAG: sulfite exporter TauE/SafE family protein [Silicimonas sp.]|nr:sulfite exporter TauE/SafE family protein [Silicimonas sp.]
MTEPQLFWVAAFAAAFFVGGSKGGLPMIALLSVPTMSLVMPPMLGAALLLPVYLISDVYGVWIYRQSYSKRNLAILIPAGAIGIVAGYLLAGRTDENVVRIVIGCVGLAFLAMRLRSRFLGRSEPKPADVPRGLFWGAVSGFTSFVSHAGGPAFQLYALPQQMPKMMFAGTSTILFAVINLMKVPPYLALGLIGRSEMGTVLILAPVAIFGAWLGYRITRIIPERIFFTIVEIALFIISVNLIRVGLSA